jgi:uncharacterized membrane protein (UPF0127 family)
MKKVLIAYGVLVLVVILLAFAKFNGSTFFQGFGSSQKATIDGKTFKIKVAKTPEERMKGLSDVKSLPKDEGMLFVFDKKGKYSFWMKNTYIPLDIIHINDGKIVEVFKNNPPQAGNNGVLPIYTPKTDANYVLEINGKLFDEYKFKIGDTVKLEGI